MRTQAIIIKKQNTNEHDQWVTVYSKEHGKLTAIAKSVLKDTSIQGMHLDLLNLVEFDLISGRGMPIISAAQVENPFQKLKGSLSSLAAAYFFLEILDKIVFDSQPDKELWDFLVSFLKKANSKEVTLATFRQNQLQLLNILGYAPQLESCNMCGAPKSSTNIWALNHSIGGIICGTCFISGGQGTILKKDDIELLSAKSNKTHQAPFRSAIDALFEYTANTKLNSLEFLYKVSA